MISRLSPEQRTPDLIHSRITEYFHRKGETSLNTWQINACVRQVMAKRVTVTHDDLINLESVIRRKETGLPGSKLSSPKNTSSQKMKYTSTLGGGNGNVYKS